MRAGFLTNVSLVAMMGFLPSSAFAAQAAAGTAPGSTPVTGQVSGLVQPALDTVLQTVSSLKLEKWKGGSVRDEAGANIHSIQQDLQSTLPPMLAQADQAAGKLSVVLPVSHNIDALYDVLLRVVDGARISGSADQVNALMQAMTNLEKARRSLDGQIADAVAAQEKQIGDLQASLKTQANPVCPVVAPVEQPAPAPKKKVHKKAKPAAGQNGQPAAVPNPAAKPKQ